MYVYALHACMANKYNRKLVHVFVKKRREAVIMPAHAYSYILCGNSCCDEKRWCLLVCLRMCFCSETQGMWLLLRQLPPHQWPSSAFLFRAWHLRQVLRWRTFPPPACKARSARAFSLPYSAAVFLLPVTKTAPTQHRHCALFTWLRLGQVISKRVGAERCMLLGLICLG
jgi:hypothetical protein